MVGLVCVVAVVTAATQSSSSTLPVLAQSQPLPNPVVSGMVPERCQPSEEGLLQPALPQMFCILDFSPFQPC